MSDHPPTLPKHLQGIWGELDQSLRPGTPPAVREAIAQQVFLIRDAHNRVNEEGSIITDGKGSAVPHPAIAIERSAADELRKWMAKYGRKST